MRVVSFIRALSVAVLSVGAVDAQTAREIVDATAQSYAKLTSYQVQATNRTVRLSPMMMGGPKEAATRYMASPGRYVQFSLKLRKPDDWSLAVQTYALTSVRTATVRGKTGEPPAPPVPENTFNSIARWEVAVPTRGRLQDEQFTSRGLTSFEFTSELRGLLIQKNVREPLLAQFDPPSGGFSNARPFNVINPELVEDTEGDPSLYKIKGKTTSGDPMVVWIEKARSVLVKAVIYTRSTVTMPTMGPGAMPGGPTSGAESRFAPRTMFTIHETLYRSQEVNPEFRADDFQIQTPATIGPINQDGLDWLSQENLIALVGEAPSSTPKTEGVAKDTPAENGTSSAPVVPAVVDAQALTQEQMSGIVLIEGDGGTATGFMTKIRDVDFIVTNLHVLGGNKKMKLKTLRGEEIPMLGVFGAVGSDIAIIRIGSGQGDLKLAADVFSSSKIGDKVVVVGNRLGGGVATQTPGSIVGVGPTRVEVNANFEPGNSGSPIVNLGTNEVVGVATYSETRRVDVDDRPTTAANAAATPPKVEKRWFGYRLDSVAKWEAIDLAKWNSQEDRIEKFRETSEALHAFIRLEFKKARLHPRLTSIIDNFDAKYRGSGLNSITAATEVKDLFRVIRTISEDGVKELTSGDYYDYFRTSLYWETSIPAQLDYRKEIVEVLKKYEANSSLYVSRLRGGS